MNQTDQDFSTQNITPQLIGQIVDALKNKAFGSVEIYIQNYKVTQITERTITKVAKASRQKITTQPKNGYQSTGIIPARVSGRDQP
jgi:hypothetical protein